ncbi:MULTISPECIES: HEPN domain-containing protein [unclassified Paraburkholderia]|uniref:HEPN domain-containing protein n=1 Tax=unclassified Paraburkholderia TaxID=2615204 RepID=UPI001618CE19|nr:MULTISPECIES: HEPN domain-containing protein [unclassified Paraburkholderia]MBB5441598.1 HEPN domain-containing protein [Paraburkholderia sp. WSM4177]MBB5481993.1 HEPN domain-containing protein [Paraburkholderia sp. WSM4180]
MDEVDDCDIGAWLASRPTLTEERNHPNHWFNRGADLHASAGALWYAMQHDEQKKIARELGFGRGYSLGVACWPVYHMMCGLALEVIMKAVLVQRSSHVEKTHSLVKLVELLRLTKSADELSMLRYYEQAVVWAGRYPVPTRCTDEKLKEYWSLAGDVLTSPVKMSSDSTIEIRTGNGASDWERFSAMWSEIASLFKHT